MYITERRHNVTALRESLCLDLVVTVYVVQSAQCTLNCRDPICSRHFSRVVNRHSRDYVRRALDAIMLLKMWLDPGAPPPTGRFTYTTYRLPTGTLTVYSIPTNAHTSWLRISFSWHAVADICCLRQQNVIFHYFHNLPLSQKLDPRLLRYFVTKFADVCRLCTIIRCGPWL